MPADVLDGGASRKRGNVSRIRDVVRAVYIKKVPSYGNSFFFTIGVYLLELFCILALTGIIMAVFGPNWANTTTAGTFLLSIHIWAAEAFITLILLHLTVNLFTSMYKRKRLVWMIGGIMLFIVLLEFAFGVGIGGSFIAQFNAAAGADLWNGMGVGYWINPLNAGAVYGWHIAVVPLLLIALMSMHFMLVKKEGLGKPYRKDIPYSMVMADHKKMYSRMAYVLAIVLVFAFFLRVPYYPPLTMHGIAQSQPDIMAVTLLNEFNFSSGTATYLDTIHPYTFSTRKVYVTVPYSKYVNLTGTRNLEAAFLAEPQQVQREYLGQAFAYFQGNGTIAAALNSSNPMIALTGQLVKMAQDGIYGAVLQGEENTGLNYTYAIRFYEDSGVLYSHAAALGGFSARQWGLPKLGGSGSGIWQVAAYWTAPYDLLEIVGDGIPGWNDLQNGIIALAAFAVLVLLPYIPGLREVPDRLKLYKVFWNRFTVPEIRERRARRRR